MASSRRIEVEVLYFRTSLAIVESLGQNEALIHRINGSHEASADDEDGERWQEL